MNNFGIRLKHLRKERNLSINHLSRLSGVSTSQISRIENNLRRTPKPETIEKLSRALKVKYESLMGLAGYIQFSDNDDEILLFTSEQADLPSCQEVSNAEMPTCAKESQDDHTSGTADTAVSLEQILIELELQQEGLMFSGQPMNDETREILISSIRHTIDVGKKFAQTGLPTSKQKIDKLLEETRGGS